MILSSAAAAATAAAAAQLLLLLQQAAATPPDPCASASPSSGAVFAICQKGFNQFDTAGTNDQVALQVALDSGSDFAIVSNIGRPWFINSSLILRSHQTVWMEPGVEIQARPGGFHCNHTGRDIATPLPPPKACRLPHRCKCHGNLTLLSAHSVRNASIVGYGATLRMHGADYNDENHYFHSQFRPAIVLAGVADFSVLGLTILSTGGDGITLMAGSTVPSPI